MDAPWRTIRGDLAGKQDEIDAWVRGCRALVDSVADSSARLAEVEVLLERYARLGQVYASDIDRLAAIEESGFAILAWACRDCVVCGVAPEA